MIKPFLKKIADNIPIPVYMTITKRDVLGLYYHVVSDERLPHIQHIYPYKSTRMFENDLIYLAKNFNLISYEQLAEHCSGGQRLKPRSVILTFDDGLSQCYSIVRPLLLKHGIPCVFFIPTDFIDNHKMLSDHKASLCIDLVGTLENSAMSDMIKSVKNAFGKEFDNLIDLKLWIKSLATHERSTIDALCQLLNIDVQQYLETQRPCMSSDEIKCLVEDGFTIGAHSASHQKLSLLTELDIEEDITSSCKIIMSVTGKSQIPFAFPFSADGVSRRMLQEIREKHPYIGLLFDTNRILPNPSFIISRLCGDWPDNADKEKSNLPQRIVRAYQEYFALRIRHQIPASN